MAASSSSSLLLRSRICHHDQYSYAPLQKRITNTNISNSKPIKILPCRISPSVTSKPCSSSSFTKLSASSTDTIMPFSLPAYNEAEEEVVSSHDVDGVKMDKVSAFFDAVWEFLRPYTIKGTLMASIAIAARVWIENSHLLNSWLPLRALIGTIIMLCANGFIVGINQIYDVDIDKINKPYLPMASGDISLKSAWSMILSFAATGFVLSLLNKSGPILTALYCLSLSLGVVYSVPPLRLKKFSIAAFLIMAVTRGFILNIGVYYACRAAIGLPFQWSPSLAFITGFVIVFGLVFALTKDLCDVEGDRQYNIETLATKVGVRKVAFVGTGFLLLNYIAAISAAIFMPQAFRGIVSIPAHAIMAMVLIFQAWVLEKAKYNKKASLEFYLFLWKLLYAEYIVFPFI